MTPQELLEECDLYERKGCRTIALRIKRTPRANALSMQLVPGLRCRLMQWGDGTWAFPSIVLCEIEDVRRAVQRATAEDPPHLTRNGVN